MAGPLPNPAELTGAILFGNAFNYLLLGILTVQCYVYHANSAQTDRWPTKVLVAVVYVFEIIQTILVFVDAYHVFCAKWGDPAALLDVGLLWISLPIMGVTMAAIVQFFYAYRIFLFSKSRWLPLVVSLISLAQFIGGIMTGVKAHQITDLTQLSLTFKSTSVWLAGTALCDIIIATSMVYHLMRARSGFKRTNLVLNKIILLTVETGLVCAAVAIVDLSLFLGFQASNYHLTPAIALSKLYSNCLLVVLNSRARIANAGRSTSDRFPQTSTLGISTNLATSKTPSINVNVTHDIQEDSYQIPMTNMVNPSNRNGYDHNWKSSELA